MPPALHTDLTATLRPLLTELHQPLTLPDLDAHLELVAAGGLVVVKSKRAKGWSTACSGAARRDPPRTSSCPSRPPLPPSTVPRPRRPSGAVGCPAPREPCWTSLSPLRDQTCLSQEGRAEGAIAVDDLHRLQRRGGCARLCRAFPRPAAGHDTTADGRANCTNGAETRSVRLSERELLAACGLFSATTVKETRSCPPHCCAQPSSPRWPCQHSAGRPVCSAGIRPGCRAAHRPGWHSPGDPRARPNPRPRLQCPRSPRRRAR